MDSLVYIVQVHTTVYKYYIIYLQLIGEVEFITILSSSFCVHGPKHSVSVRFFFFFLSFYLLFIN